VLQRLSVHHTVNDTATDYRLQVEPGEFLTGDRQAMKSPGYEAAPDDEV
jgi:hypothetical protein